MGWLRQAVLEGTVPPCACACCVRPHSARRLQPSQFSSDNLVVAAAFHPLSDNHVVVLSLDGLRLFNVKEARWVDICGGMGWGMVMVQVGNARLPSMPHTHPSHPHVTCTQFPLACSVIVRVGGYR
jgi:hypothetical protein